MESPDREANGYDLVSFVLQLVQVCPIATAWLTTLIPGVWAMRVATALVLSGSWPLAWYISARRRGRRPRTGDTLGGTTITTVQVTMAWPGIEKSCDADVLTGERR